MRTFRTVTSRRSGIASDRGVVALLTAILVPALLVLTAVAIDGARWYVEVSRLQTAADAAALAGVPNMPYDFDRASSVALEVSGSNGYANVGTTKVVPFTTQHDSELGVSVTSTINNVFGSFFGNPTTTITRTAVADFQDAAIMGSPCNRFGNEPPSNAGAAQPVGTVVPTQGNPPGGQGGFATCQDPAQFWGLLEGPVEEKVNGDRYANIICGFDPTTNPDTRPDGCNGDDNLEYLEENYFWVMRVQEAAVGVPINIQLYDAGYYGTGNTCEDIPSGATANMNDYALTDAPARYDDSANIYCTGDNAGGSGSTQPMTASFVLRGQTDTLDPLKAAPIAHCTRQFRGVENTPTQAQLRQYPNPPSRPNYVAGLAQVFHQWVNLCDTPFIPWTAGDYYIQVRSNVALPSGTPASTYMSTADNPQVTADAGDERNTDGINGFAIRAAISPINLGTSVSVSGFERMPIWVNIPGGTATFNLLQVAPNAKGKSFDFNLFDLGDADEGGTLTILPPVGAAGTWPVPNTPCILRTPAGTATNLTNCSMDFTNHQFNGDLRTISVPIPPDYNCNGDSLGACWWLVELAYDDTVNDVTTWDARIQGDAVRLVQ